MTLWFVTSLIQKRNDVADEAWGLGFILVCCAALLCVPLSVAGIPMTERRYAGREDFESYKKRTSAFLPLPPKRVRS